MILFEDHFTDGIKLEWETLVGSWEHNAEFDAYQVSGQLKNKTKVNITTPDDILVECKIVKINTLQNTYFDLLSRYSFSSNSGYSIAYMEVYSRYYDCALFLIRWDNNSRKGYLAECYWSDLGLTGITDLEGKTIGIKVEGNVIKGYLDGVEILSAIDDTYPLGQVGIIANPQVEAFVFDDFKIADIVVETPPIEETKQLAVLDKGGGAFIFEKPELAITDVIVMPKATLNNVAITIKELKTNPNATQLAKKVFKYLEISKENIEDADIDAIKINFRVPIVWIVENELCDKVVFLYKSINNKWIKCNMNKLKRDKEFHYYEAQTTSLSDFGMGGNPGC